MIWWFKPRVALGLEDGAKLRVDTTVVETDIHHPTDNTLLWDVVRAPHAPGRPPCQGAGDAMHQGFSTIAGVQHTVACMRFQRMTTRQRPDRQTADLPGADRHCRGGGGERQSRTRQDRQHAWQGPVLPR